MATIDSRNNIVKAARFAVDHKTSAKFAWDYAEIRPIPLNMNFTKKTDCSGFATWCYWVAGVADPNGQNYSGQGYTGTLLSHGTHIAGENALPGDLIVYGPGTGWHVGVIVEIDGLNVLTVSHGQQGDPSYVWVNPPRGTIPLPARNVHVSDGRKPQTYLRFNTTQIRNPQILPTV